MRIDELDFELPPERIAQEPPSDRADCRLMVVRKAGAQAPEHRTFHDVVELIAPGTLVVLNETRVIPARFLGRRESGGKVELLLVRPLPASPGDEEPQAGSDSGVSWEALVRAGGALRADEVLTVEEGAARVQLVAALGGGRYRVRFVGEDALSAAERCGRMPLPPYIKREATAADRETYQTVFARVPGAIAAPTAGLHFTPALLAALEARGVGLARLVLHVGLGTFMPVRVDEVSEHRMEAERYEVPAATQAALQAAKAEARPVLAVGTTVVRALEAYARSGEARGATDLFVHPPFEFRLVDQLITNFHLPRTTLLLLVAALAGREPMLAAYREAVERGYRFYSYGDAMLVR